MPLLFNDNENLSILVSIAIMFFGGISLAFTEGFQFYNIAFAVILTICIFATILYIIIVYSKILNDPINYEIEMSHTLGHSVTGDAPIQTREIKEFKGVY